MDTDTIIKPPKMCIALLSEDSLQLTVTKTLLELSSELGEVCKL